MKALEERGAEFSEDRTERFCLWRVWDSHLPSLMAIGLNPSTADENQDDPTIRRLLGFARRWGYGELIMMNIFPFRATDPTRMRAHYLNAPSDDPTWDRLKVNRALIQNDGRAVQQQHGGVLAAWGAHGTFLTMGATVVRDLEEAGIEAACLGWTTGEKSQPKHVLYMPSDATPWPWVGGGGYLVRDWDQK